MFSYDAIHVLDPTDGERLITLKYPSYKFRTGHHPINFGPDIMLYYFLTCCYTMATFRFSADRELLSTVLRFEEVVSHTSGDEIRRQIFDDEFVFASVMLNRTDGRIASIAVLHRSAEMISAIRIVSIGFVSTSNPTSVQWALSGVVVAALQTCAMQGFVNVFSDRGRPFEEMGFTEYSNSLMHCPSFHYNAAIEVSEWVFSGTEAIVAVPNAEGVKKIPKEFESLFAYDVIDVTCGGAIDSGYVQDLLFNSDVDLDCMFVIRNNEFQLTGIAVLGVISADGDIPSYGELFILCSNRYLVSDVRGRDIMQRILHYFKCNHGLNYVHLTAAGTTLYSNNYPSMGFSGGTVADIVGRGCDSGIVPLLHEVYEKGCYHMTRCLKDITATTPITLFPINQTFSFGVSTTKIIEIQNELDRWRDRQTSTDDLWGGVPDLLNMTKKSANAIANDPYITGFPRIAMDVDDGSDRYSSDSSPNDDDDYDDDDDVHDDDDVDDDDDDDYTAFA